MPSPPRPDPAQEDAKWEAYPETILEFLGPPPLVVDLRKPIDAPTRHSIRQRVGDSSFRIFTAENPAGENAEDACTDREEERRARRNDQRTSRLEEELARAGTRFLVLDGVSPDGAYRERCVAALLPRRESVALARRYAQLALFWFDGDTFWLLPGLADKDPRPLP